MSKKVPKSLRIWFLIHFIVDMLFAIPLIVIPRYFLKFLGFMSADPFTARLVGAALIGIGGVSLVAHNKGNESYSSLLSLKILWSLAAIVAILWTMIEGGPFVGWYILGVFAVFSGIWMYYKRKIR